MCALNHIEHISRYVKAAGLPTFDFGDAGSLRQAISEPFDESNKDPENDLALRFREPSSKHLLKVASPPEMCES